MVKKKISSMFLHFTIKSCKAIQATSNVSDFTVLLTCISIYILNIISVLNGSYIPPIAKQFMNSTRAQVEHEHILVTASSFTFGREALLPSIFIELIKQSMLKVNVSRLFNERSA